MYIFVIIHINFYCTVVIVLISGPMCWQQGADICETYAPRIPWFIAHLRLLYDMTSRSTELRSFTTQFFSHISRKYHYEVCIWSPSHICIAICPFLTYFSLRNVCVAYRAAEAPIVWHHVPQNNAVLWLSFFSHISQISLQSLHFVTFSYLHCNMCIFDIFLTEECVAYRAAEAPIVWYHVTQNSAVLWLNFAHISRWGRLLFLWAFSIMQ